MDIKNTEGLSNEDLKREIDRGGRFVMYQFTISIIVMTFKRSSEITFIKSGESGVLHGLPFTMLSFLFGWWGIPWGPIYTIQSLFNNLRGGIDVTKEVSLTLFENDQQKIEQHFEELISESVKKKYKIIKGVIFGMACLLYLLPIILNLSKFNSLDLSISILALTVLYVIQYHLTQYSPDFWILGIGLFVLSIAVGVVLRNNEVAIQISRIFGIWMYIIGDSILERWHRKKKNVAKVVV